MKDNLLFSILTLLNNSYNFVPLSSTIFIILFSKNFFLSFSAKNGTKSHLPSSEELIFLLKLFPKDNNKWSSKGEITEYVRWKKKCPSPAITIFAWLPKKLSQVLSWWKKSIFINSGCFCQLLPSCFIDIYKINTIFDSIKNYDHIKCTPISAWHIL